MPPRLHALLLFLLAQPLSVCGLRVAVLLTGQLARLELASKTELVLAPLLADGHHVVIFACLDDTSKARASSSYVRQEGPALRPPPTPAAPAAAGVCVSRSQCVCVVACWLAQPLVWPLGWNHECKPCEATRTPLLPRPPARTEVCFQTNSPRLKFATGLYAGCGERALERVVQAAVEGAAPPPPGGAAHSLLVSALYTNGTRNAAFEPVGNRSAAQSKREAERSPPGTARPLVVGQRCRGVFRLWQGGAFACSRCSASCMGFGDGFLGTVVLVTDTAPTTRHPPQRFQGNFAWLAGVRACLKRARAHEAAAPAAERFDVFLRLRDDSLAFAPFRLLPAEHTAGFTSLRRACARVQGSRAARRLFETLSCASLSLSPLQRAQLRRPERSRLCGGRPPRGRHAPKSAGRVGLRGRHTRASFARVLPHCSPPHTPPRTRTA